VADRRLIGDAGRIQEPADHEPPPSAAHLRQRRRPCEGEAESQSGSPGASMSSRRTSSVDIRR